MNILIVDDSENARMILKKTLESNGYSVKEASNGKEALKAAKESPPDMIITDILMPVMDGFHLCREVTADEILGDIPFVFYTATYTDEKDEELALKCGADRFIRKPAEPDEFMNIIQVVIKDAKEGRLKARAVKEESKYDFKLYSERLVKKLEKKMLDLELEIAERKQADEALRESEERFRTVADFTHDCEYWIAPDGRVLYVSPSCERITGYGPEEFVNDPELFVKIVHPDDHSIVVDHIREEQSLKRLPSMDFRITTRSGEERWISHVCQAVYGADGTYLGRRGSNRDISKRKKMEEELLKVKKLESLGVLAGGIAHDFNNMLTAVLGNISLAQMTAETYDTEETVKLLTGAEKAAMRARDLTARLITFSEGAEPFKEEVSIGEFVKDSVTSALSGTGISCELNIPADVWPVRIDKSQMKQAMHNIVTNSIEAMPGQGLVKVYCRNIDISEKDGLTLKHEKHVKISLKDQGSGIAKENLSKVFDPYFSTKERGTQKGMGLGLATSHSIIKKLGGLITIESQLGSGTNIHIYIPAVTAKRPSERDPALHGAGEEPSAKRDQAEREKVDEQYSIQRILVMDDEEMLRDVSSAMLTKLGYEAEVAIDGVEAIEIYQKAKESDQPFDLVILDLTNNYGMGGVEAIEKLLEIDTEVRAIVATGYSFDPIVSNFRQYGFCGAITKPFSMGDLGKAVQEALKV